MLTHRCRSSMAALLLAGLACREAPSLPATPAPSTIPPPPPNIIVFNLDDLPARSWEFLTGTVPPRSWFRAEAQIPEARAHMPFARGLMDQGVTFSRSYVAAPVCSPSRVSLLSGLFVHSHQVYGNNWPNGGFGRYVALDLDQQTVAVLLERGGYRTGIFGKYLNEFPRGIREIGAPMPGWDEWYVPFETKYWDFHLDENGQTFFYERSLTANGDPDWNYHTRVLGRKLRAFLAGAVERRQPFFAYVPLRTPHRPSEPAERHASAFPDRRCEAPRTLSFDEDTRDKPELRFTPPMSALQIREADRWYCAFLRTTMAVEDLLVEVDAALTALGQRDNTVIVITADNGHFHGEHRIPSGKDMVYDEASRAPLVFWGPAIPRGRVLEHLVSNVDLAPTILEWAGLPVPDRMEGRSLLPVIRGTVPAEQWRQAVLFERYDDGELEEGDAPRGAGFAAIRTAQHVYAEYAGGDRELYDMERDPMQLDNLFSVGSPDAATVARLQAQLHRLQQCRGMSCR